MWHELDLPRKPTAPGLARRTANRWLDDTLGEDELDAAKTVVSELVTNAVTHGAGHVRLTLDLDGDRLRIEVIDQGSGFAHDVREAPFHQTRGRGLLIVDAISSRWGIHEGTTHVWAEIEREGPRLATPH